MPFAYAVAMALRRSIVPAFSAAGGVLVCVVAGGVSGGDSIAHGVSGGVSFGVRSCVGGPESKQWFIDKMKARFNIILSILATTINPEDQDYSFYQ